MLALTVLCVPYSGLNCLMCATFWSRLSYMGRRWWYRAASTPTQPSRSSHPSTCRSSETPAAKHENHSKRFSGRLPESQGQILAVAVGHEPYSLASTETEKHIGSESRARGAATAASKTPPPRASLRPLPVKPPTPKHPALNPTPQPLNFNP